MNDDHGNDPQPDPTRSPWRAPAGSGPSARSGSAPSWAFPLFLIGLAVVAAAVILALTPVTASGADCGSALNPSQAVIYPQDLVNAQLGLPSQDLAGQCDDKIAGRRTLMFAMGGPALGAVVVGFFTWAMTRQPQREAS